MPAPYTPPVSEKPQPETTAQLIERLSSNFVTTINDRDFDFSSEDAQELMSHISPDWRAQLQSFTDGNASHSLEEQIVIWRRRVKEHPDTEYGIDSVFSDVNEHAGTAIVYVNMYVAGIAEARLYNMNQCTWKRNSEGKWIWLGTQGE